MNGQECITGAIDLFEEQLETVFLQKHTTDRNYTVQMRSTTALAEKCGYSLWHFIRLFSAITGMNPKEYITRRIMTQCAGFIASLKTDGNRSTLSSVAFMAGFDDYETFSRSFRRYFGFSPRKLKETGSLDPVSALLTPRFIPQPNRTYTKTGVLAQSDSEWFTEAGLKAEIIDKPPFHITGLPFYLDEKIPSFDRIWASFSAKQQLIAGRTEPEHFCQYTAWAEPIGNSLTVQGSACPKSGNYTNEDASILVLCALITDPSAVQKPVFTNRVIPGGKFLHCIHSDGIETISDTYNRIYCGFIAKSELPFTSCWEYQTYNADGTTNIYIPLDR